jgi:hypothetical protein
MTTGWNGRAKQSAAKVTTALPFVGGTEGLREVFQSTRNAFSSHSSLLPRAKERVRWGMLDRHHQATTDPISTKCTY